MIIFPTMEKNLAQYNLTRQGQGFTLAELCISLAITGLLITLATPSFQSLLTRSALASETSAFRQAVQIARENAIAQLQEITICPLSGQNACGDNWNEGWQIIAADGAILLRHELSKKLFINSNRKTLVTRPLLRSTNGTVIFCDKKRFTKGHGVVISYSGKTRYTDSTNPALNCA